MPEHDLPEISISEEKLCFIIEKAREFESRMLSRTRILHRIQPTTP